MVVRTYQSILCIATSLISPCSSFAPSVHANSRNDGNSQLFVKKYEECNRRNVFTSATAAAASAMLVVGTRPAQANDDVFKKNPLTNPVLEQIRIWEQAEADELKYGGELEMGNAGNRGKTGAYPKLLVPILTMASELSTIEADVQNGELIKARKVLKQSKYDKVAFKKTFNQFADNIYYSDPDRANLYLGGGATPKNEQSIAYLLRNDLLTNVESLQAELDYLLADSTSEDERKDTADLFAYAKTCNDAMKRYLELVPPSELQAAKELLASK